MKNYYIDASHLAMHVWAKEQVYITDNGDGTWHVAHEYGAYSRHSDVSPEQAQQVIDGVKERVQATRDPANTHLRIEEITPENAESLKAALMKQYDGYTEYIENSRQRDFAEAKNKAILAQVARIEKALRDTQVA